MRRLLLASLLIWLMAGADAWANSRQAVLVGVGKYHPDTIDKVDLEGPPNDLAVMRRILSLYGFDDNNTTVLADNRATREAILAAVRSRLLGQAPNSLAVFYFSGHGSALRSRSQVGEFNDETIVPYDGRVRGRPYADIIDDEIYDWIREFNSKGISAVLIFDSCLSGGIAKPAIEVRRMPSVTINETRTTDGILSLRQAPTSTLGSAIMVLTASSASDFAYSKIAPASGLVQGVMTTALQMALQPEGHTPPPVTWRGIAAAIGSLLATSSGEPPAQMPQFYGAVDAKVFASGAPFSHAIIARRKSSTVAVLDKGGAFGVTQGSLFKLFDTTQVPWRSSDDFAALGRVSRVDDTQAELLINGSDLQKEQYAAVEFEYAIPTVKIAARIPPESFKDKTDAAAVQDALESFQAGVSAQGNALELVISNTPQGLQVVTPDGRLVGDPFQLTDSVSIRDRLRQRIAAYARWQRIFNWKRPSPPGSIGVRFRIEYERSGAKAIWTGGDLNTVRIPAGATMKLAVSNSGTQALNGVAILLRQDFGIDVCPVGKVARNDENATEEVALGPRTGAGAWKIVISDSAHPMNLDFLRADGNTRVARGSVLLDEIGAVWNGASLASTRSAGTAEFDWQTVDVPFEVVNPPQAAPAAQKPPQAAPAAQRTERCLGFPEK
jgi:hypothetical protein